jgi:hypothetical protein
MKKTITILCLSGVLISCQTNPNTSGIVLKNDEKSTMSKSHLEAYMMGDFSVAETLFTEDLLIHDQFSN